MSEQNQKYVAPELTHETAPQDFPQASALHFGILSCAWRCHACKCESTCIRCFSSCFWCTMLVCLWEGHGVWEGKVRSPSRKPAEAQLASAVAAPLFPTGSQDPVANPFLILGVQKLRRGPRGASHEKFHAAPSKKQARFLEGPLSLRTQGKSDLLRSLFASKKVLRGTFCGLPLKN